MQALNQQLGQHLRQCRQARGWSLDQAAEACGVSKAMLGQIERGESSPSVVTLWKIAAGFRLSYTSLLAPLDSLSQPVELPAESAVSAGIRVTSLLPFCAETGYELMLVELPVGCCYQSVPHEPGALEQIMPLDPGLSIWLAGAWQAWLPGQALRFAADQPHGYRNDGLSPVRFYNQIHYPARPSR